MSGGGRPQRRPISLLIGRTAFEKAQYDLMKEPRRKCGRLPAIRETGPAAYVQMHRAPEPRRMTSCGRPRYRPFRETATSHPLPPSERPSIRIPFIAIIGSPTRDYHAYRALRRFRPALAPTLSCQTMSSMARWDNTVRVRPRRRLAKASASASEYVGQQKWQKHL